MNTIHTFDPVFNIFIDFYKDNQLLFYLFRFFIIFLLISLCLFIILKGEKPGILAFKNNYYIFFMAIIPSLLLGFYHNFFHFYLEENVNNYLERKMESKTLQQLGISPDSSSSSSEYSKLQDLINIKSIVITTLSLAISYYFSNLIKLIIDKGIINDIIGKKGKKKLPLTAEEYIQKKSNPFTNFLGVILGGSIFAIVYFINKERYFKNLTIIPNRLMFKGVYNPNTSYKLDEVQIS